MSYSNTARNLTSCCAKKGLKIKYTLQKRREGYAWNSENSLFSIEIKICSTHPAQLRYSYITYLISSKINIPILNAGKQVFFPFPLLILMNEQQLNFCNFYPTFQLSKFWDCNISMSLEKRVSYFEGKKGAIHSDHCVGKWLRITQQLQRELCKSLETPFLERIWTLGNFQSKTAVKDEQGKRKGQKTNSRRLNFSPPACCSSTSWWRKQTLFIVFLHKKRVVSHQLWGPFRRKSLWNNAFIPGTKTELGAYVCSCTISSNPLFCTRTCQGLFVELLFLLLSASPFLGCEVHKDHKGS